MRCKSVLFAAAIVLPLTFNTAAQESEIQGENGSIKVKPLVHSSVQIEYDGLVIQVDPWSAIDLSSALPADIILISDDVGHHLDKAAIEMLRKPSTEIIMPQSGAVHLPEGKILNNGEVLIAQGIKVESVAAYDIIPGEPSHLKGDANAYLVELGGKRILFAGVTECVSEILALGRVDIAFMPMNIPVGRMTPSAAAECTRALAPEVVFLYHYDQGYAARVTRPEAGNPQLPGNLTIEQSLKLFEQELQGSGIEFRMAEWYPLLN
ncbi:MAG: MBL fold metallo-hydrolase [Hydrogenophaga sp.]|nr:MBL fold metallo-hydrolase [Hydrogenophaga sp.]